MAPTVLITGASQGIGKATALLFARKGYDLTLAARHNEGLLGVAQEVQSLGRETPLTVPCDVTWIGDITGRKGVGAWYDYEFWQDGDRLVKKSKYIPKRLLTRIQELEAEKTPVKEILKLLRVKL